MPDLVPIGTVTPEEQAKVIDALRTTEAREVLQDVIKNDSVDITDLPQTSILSGTSLPILEDGELKVVPFAALANSIGSAIDTANAASQQVVDKIDEFEQAVEDAQDAVDAANAAATRATTAAEQAEALGLEDTTGQSTTKAMTQKAVTDAVEILSEPSVPLTFTDGSGIQKANGIQKTTSNYAVTPYLDVSDYDMLLVPVVKVSVTYGYALYDESKTFISGGSMTSTVDESGYIWFRVPTNGAKYLRYTSFSSGNPKYDGRPTFKVIKTIKNVISDTLNKIGNNEDFDLVKVNETPYSYANVYIRAAEKNWNHAVNNACVIVPVSPGERYSLDTSLHVAYLTDNAHADESNPSYVDGTSLTAWGAGDIWEIPPTTAYLYVRTQASGNAYAHNLYRVVTRNEKIRELEDVVAECNESVIDATYLDVEEEELSVYPIKNGVYIGASDGVWHTGITGNGCIFIPVNEGDIIQISTFDEGVEVPSYAIFLKDNIYKKKNTPHYVDSVPGYSNWPIGEKRVVPSDATFLYLRTSVSGRILQNSVYIGKSVKSTLSSISKGVLENKVGEKSIIRNAALATSLPALRLIHYSDIHGDGKAASLLRDSAEKYANSIDDMVVTGDVATFYAEGTDSASYPNGWDWWRDCGLAEKTLFVLGNHDGATINSTEYDTKDGNAAWDGKGQGWDFETYIEPYFEDLGIILPEGYDDETSIYYQACFWYKDYDSAKVRLIGLDVVHRFDGTLDPNNNWQRIADGVKHNTTEQEEWLIELLAEAKSLGYSVIACGHYPMEDFNGGSSEWSEAQHKWICNQKSSGGYVMSEKTNSMVNFHYEGVKSNTLDRKYNLRNRVGTTSSWSKGTTNNIANIIQAFIDDEGKFIAYLCGHCHCDLMFYYKDILSIAVTQTGWLRGGSAEDKSELDESRLSANLIAFDTSNGLLKIARLGSKTNRFLTPLNGFCYDYINRKVISEW